MGNVAADDPLVGTSIGSYVVARRLGQGGMGTVYEVVHPGIGKRLALKLLHAEHSKRPEIVQRFFDEARAVNLIQHPNIVDIIDFSQLPDGRSYILMEFLEGEALSDLLRRRGALPAHEVRALILPVCDALAAAHATGITHRDLKPENIYLARRPGDEPRVKVLDFGIAKLADSLRLDPAASGTVTGVVMGTPLYMSPEQAMGKVREIDHRTDVYALGVMLFEMLAGRAPFVSDNFPALIVKHINEPPPPLRKTRPELPHSWEAIVERALAKTPAERFDSMTDLAQAIRATSREPEVAVSRARAGRPRSTLTIGLGLIALLTAAALGFLVLSRRSTAGERAHAGSSEAGALATEAAAPRDRATPPARRPDPPPDAAPPPVAEADVEPARDADGTRHPPRSRDASAPGRLKVTAKPWAQVFIDGRARGPSPVTAELSPGLHRVLLVNPELGVREKRRVRVVSGKLRELRIDLRP